MNENNITRYYGCKVAYERKTPSAFGVVGRIKTMLFPSSVGEAEYILNKLREQGQRYIVVGLCNNILFPDGTYDTVVVSLSELKGLKLSGGGIYAMAGEKLSELCHFAKNNCLSGLERLWTIPSSVGGGIAMNCGCFGAEISDTLQYCDCWKDGKIERVFKSERNFAYRRSDILDNGWVVLGAQFNLAQGDICVIDSVMKSTKAQRLATQPQQKSLGSVFKKVGDISAGYYIEAVGLKGAARGGAKISEKHANFIVNCGGATSSDFLYLATLAQQEVDKRYSIELQYEVKILQ